MKMWEPKPPGTLWATPGLLRDSFTFYLFTRDRVKCHCVLCCLRACQCCHDGTEGKEWTGVFASVLVHASEEGSGMFATNGIYSRAKKYTSLKHVR